MASTKRPLWCDTKRPYFLEKLSGSRTRQQHQCTAVRIEKLLPKVAGHKDKEFERVGPQRLEILAVQKSRSTTKDFTKG